MAQAAGVTVRMVTGKEESVRERGIEREKEFEEGEGEIVRERKIYE